MIYSSRLFERGDESELIRREESREKSVVYILARSCLPESVLYEHHLHLFRANAWMPDTRHTRWLRAGDVKSFGRCASEHPRRASFRRDRRAIWKTSLESLPAARRRRRRRERGNCANFLMRMLSKANLAASGNRQLPNCYFFKISDSSSRCALSVLLVI